jgi:hypothetical protein
MNTGKLRLLHLRDQTEAVGADMIEERARISAIRNAEPVRAVSAFNLFQTPPELARRMVDMLPAIDASDSILEPSAGLGRIYRAIRGRSIDAHVTLVESSADCCGELYRATEGDTRVTIRQRDFLEYHPGPRYAAVVMNPPFKRGTDVQHIRHARRLLSPGGVLVALCFDGSIQAKGLQPIASTWEPLGPDVFKSEGTRAPVVLLTIQN